MKNPFNTLLGRLATMTVGLIVAVHVTSLFVVDRERGQIDAEHARRDVMLAVQAKHDGEASARHVAQTLGIEYIADADVLSSGCPTPCTGTNAPFEHDLLPRLPPGSRVVFDPRTGSLWIRYGSEPYWMYMRNANLPGMRFLGSSLVMLVLAVCAALLAAWQFQRPLHRLAGAARDPASVQSCRCPHCPQ